MGKQNRQQRRAADRDKEAYGFAKLASLKITPKSPPPKPRGKLSLTLVVSVIIGVIICMGAYVAYSSGRSGAPVARHLVLPSK